MTNADFLQKGIAVVVRRCEPYGQVMNERRRNEDKAETQWR